MRLALNPRARRLLRSLPLTTVYTVAELLLLSLLAIQCARLFWVFVTPVDPVGEWRSNAFKPAPASTALLGSFDPFFRLNGGGQAVVTSLNLKLFGVRENRATGRGSAIVATPDGIQRSFAVGEEIMPGVTLAAVGFDSITVSRGGTMEQLFLDQSPPATLVGPSGAPPPPAPVMTVPAVQAPAPPPAISLAAEVQVQARLQDGRVTGVIVNPQGTGQTFRMAGLRPGDVITSVNGRAINSPEQAQALASTLGNQDEVEFVVERGGQPVTLRARTRP